MLYSNCAKHRHPNDSELVSALLRGDRREWSTFRHRYDPVVLRSIRRATAPFTSILDSEGNQDILAYFWLTVAQDDMRKLRAFDPERGVRLSTWLGRLAFNAARDRLRVLVREPRFDDLALHDQYDADERDPCEVLLYNECVAQFDERIASFSARDREFVRLFYAEGRSAQEVSDEMNISVKTVYSKKHKLHARLAG